MGDKNKKLRKGRDQKEGEEGDYGRDNRRREGILSERREEVQIRGVVNK